MRRQIHHADGTQAEFIGTAQWLAQGNDLICHEMGDLSLANGARLSAERRYLWKPDLTVWFEDGRFFHAVPARGGATSHWCDPDRYDGHYDFSGWPGFETRWRVTGPRKDYRMTNWFTRVD